MAENSVLKEIIVRAKAEGVENSTNALEVLQVAIDAVGASGKLTTPELNKLTSVVSRLDTATKGASTQMKGFGASVRSMAPGFKDIHQEVAKITAELQKQAQLAAASGSQNPMGDAIKAVGISEKDVKLIERYNDALGVDATSAARAFRTEQGAASKQTALYNQYLFDQEKAVGRVSTSLPTLRYALHDVSNQLLIVGGAMLAFSTLSFKAAIDYERSFANVIRTNDQLMSSQVSAQRAFREFVDLAGEIPRSFGDLTEIGTLAGQLGVSSAKLTDFTRTVAMFSTVTGESIDTTATAFGRLDALLPDVQGNFDALGSSILNVGINSVATEGEVIKITTQLAGIGRQAGLTYDELVGLSGALASVGVQPELARGTITRLFGQISRAVTTGGDNLEGFARISGTTADQFASQWNSAPMAAVTSVFEGLKARGGEAEAALRQVGITSVRDVPAILRLSQTVDTVLTPALADAAAGAREGSQLAENYGVIAETLASKLQVLANNFQSLAASAGENAAVFGFVVDSINGMLVALRKLMENPVTAFFAQTAVLVAAAGGTILVLTSLVARGAAGFLAYRTAMQQAGITSVGFRANLVALSGTISGVNAQTVAGAGNMGRFANSMRVAGAASAVLIGIPVINWLDDFVAKSRGAVVDVDSLTKAISKMNAGLDAATQKDISDTLNKSLESLGSSVDGVSIWESTNILSSTEAMFRRMMNTAETEVDAGLQRLTQKTASWVTANPFTGEANFLAGFLDPSIAQIEEFENAWISAWESAGSETQKQAILTALNDLKAGMTTEEVEAFEYNLRNLYDVIGSGVNTTALLAEQNEITADSFEELQGAMMQVITDVFESVNAQYALADSLSTLGAEYVKTGAAAAFTGSAMQATIKEIVEQSSSSGVAAANLQVLFDRIVAGGYASASQLSHLRSVIAGLQAQAGGKVSAPTITLPDFSAFQRGMASAARSTRGAGAAAKEARKEIRTLIDYANDLSKVWSRAFDIRFDRQSTLDSITSAFISIREAADAAAQKIRDLNNDIASLTSDISIQDYFLSIAIEYGDTKRAEALEAELAKKRAELADKTAELQKQQDSLNKGLVGNSSAAIDNRKTILDLVTQYQGYLKALAESGTSQGNLSAAAQGLKADFMAQATQLGFNATELAKYALAFDDVSAAAGSVRFDVTTNLSSLDPALLAIREFTDKANESLNSIGSGMGGSLGGSFEEAAPIADAGGQELGNLAGKAWKDRLELAKRLKLEIENGKITSEQAANQLGIGIGGAAATGAGNAMSNPTSGFGAKVSGPIVTTNSIASNAASVGFNIGREVRAGITFWLNQNVGNPARGVIRSITGFQSGGFTGRGAPDEFAGIVHKGEYVLKQSMVNQSTGLPNMDALGRAFGGVSSPAPAPASRGGGSSGTSMVSLTPATIQAIAQATGKNIVLEGQVIAQTTSNQYAYDNSIGAN